MNKQGISVYYHFLKDKKVNGTLFYCFEYFEYLSRYEKNTYFLIYQINSEDLEFVKNIFKSKYNFDYILLDRIISINSIKEIYEFQGLKNLILDIRTFNSVYSLIQGSIFAFVNERGALPRSKMKNIYFYGSYDYQSYDIYCTLKFNFDIFKQSNNPLNGKVFTSGGLLNKLGRENSKKPNEFFNIFDEYESFRYIHNTLDVNNRFIVECFYYNRDLEFVQEIRLRDSAVIRFEDCIRGHIMKYRLDYFDRIVQDILDDNTR